MSEFGFFEPSTTILSAYLYSTEYFVSLSAERSTISFFGIVRVISRFRECNDSAPTAATRARIRVGDFFRQQRFRPAPCLPECGEISANHNRD